MADRAGYALRASWCSYLRAFFAGAHRTGFQMHRFMMRFRTSSRAATIAGEAWWAGPGSVILSFAHRKPSRARRIGLDRHSGGNEVRALFPYRPSSAGKSAAGRRREEGTIGSAVR